MQNNHLLGILYFCLCPLILSAQLTGKVLDDQGEPLAFATVYVVGTTNGTTTNVDGEYQLALEPGYHSVRYQYVGYRTKTMEIEAGNVPLRQDVILSQASYTLGEAVVIASAEDPAYAVIRKAQAQRKYYRELLRSYRCKSYIKATHRFLSAPQKVLGYEVGDMGGVLDTMGRGIFYLSESVSEIYYQRPKIKEVMISSRVSGDPGGYSFNRAGVTELNFYDNVIRIGRDMVSPIAAGAMSYYRYQLEGVDYDAAGRMINKIKLTPKNSASPCFSGYIYIVEGSWNIHSLDLVTDAHAMKLPILDSLRIQQQYISIPTTEYWVVMNQNIQFDFDVMGFRGKGSYAGSFSDYEINPLFGDDFFDSTVFEVQDSSNLKSQEYWAEKRPVPLTSEETSDYIKKDSLQRIWTSKPYLDSMDALGNKFKLINLLSGYRYDKSYEHFSFRFKSPLSTLLFNPVQGYYFDLDFLIRKEADDDATRWWEINPLLQYGFSDKKLRAGISFKKRFNSIRYPELGVRLGTELAQVNRDDPISPMLSTYYNLILKENHIRLFDRKFIEWSYGREVADGWRTELELGYSERNAVKNRSNFSYFDTDRLYAENDILREGVSQLQFEEHRIFEYAIKLIWQPGQRYIKYPNKRYASGSKWPKLGLRFRGAADILGTDQQWLKVSLAVTDDFRLSTFGMSSWTVRAGGFLNKERILFIDYQHFMGNQTLFYNPEKMGVVFFALPYYAYSTADDYFSLHYQHRFMGKLLDQIPWVKKLGLSGVVGFNVLKIKDQDPYFEWSVGLDEIGIGIFRLLRVDGIWSRGQSGKTRFVVRLGLSM